MSIFCNEGQRFILPVLCLLTPTLRAGGHSPYPNKLTVVTHDPFFQTAYKVMSQRCCLGWAFSAKYQLYTSLITSCCNLYKIKYCSPQIRNNSLEAHLSAKSSFFPPPPLFVTFCHKNTRCKTSPLGVPKFIYRTFLKGMNHFLPFLNIRLPLELSSCGRTADTVMCLHTWPSPAM